MARPDPTVSASPPPPPRAAQRGTTLVELMVGLALLSVLAGISIPGVMSLWRSYNLRSAADDVIQAVDFARAQAQSTRRAYVLTLGAQVANGPLKFEVWQSNSASCKTWSAGREIHTRAVDYRPTNPRNAPAVQVTRFAPSDLATSNAHVCIKPDGRVLRSDLALAFSPPVGTAMPLGAGDVILELQRVESGNAVGVPVQVQIGYNGTARLTYGRDTVPLVGSGLGGNP